MLPTITTSGAQPPLLAVRKRLLGAKLGGAMYRSWLAGIALVAALLVLVYEANVVSPSGGTSAVARRGSSASRRALVDRRFPAASLNTLVMVACHSVYTGLDFAHPEDDSSWFLLDYQKDVPGQTHSFVEHIKLGVAQAAANPQTMLLFSGGKTRRGAGPRTEALGYWLLAEANGWFGYARRVRERAYTEDHARDSFENILFSLCRFYELAGHYPKDLILVGYEFKRARFLEQHSVALQWPPERVQYVGTPALTAGAAEGEAKTAAAFASDPYGCSGELAAKRAERDPFANGGYSGETCPALADVLKYCGPQLYEGRLPWSKPVPSS